MLDQLILEPGAIYQTGGYLDFVRLSVFTGAQAIFVTRAKKDLRFRRRYSHPVDRSIGLICDQTILLTGVRSADDYPVPPRRIRYKDPQTAKTLLFLTNNFTLPALTIAELYRYRWQIKGVAQLDHTRSAHQLGIVM